MLCSCTTLWGTEYRAPVRLKRHELRHAFYDASLDGIHMVVTNHTDNHPRLTSSYSMKSLQYQYQRVALLVALKLLKSKT